GALDAGEGRLRRHVLPASRRPAGAEAGPEAASSDPDRGERREGNAEDRREARRYLELRGRRYRDLQAQGRGAEGTLRDGRSRLWRDPAIGPAPDRYQRYRGHDRRRAGVYRCGRDAHGVLPVAAVQDWHGDDAGRAGDPEAGTTLGAISISP